MLDLNADNDKQDDNDIPYRFSLAAIKPPLDTTAHHKHEHHTRKHMAATCKAGKNRENYT
jgi:hypothetical protein